MIGAAVLGAIAAAGLQQSAPSGAHRYWRLLFTGAGSAIVALADLQLYEDAYGSNVATGGSASADTALAFYPASDAFDTSIADEASNTSGPETSVWASDNTAFPHWLKYDFGAGNEKEILAVGIHGRRAAWATQCPVEFSVQHSDDNTNWTTAWAESGLTWGDFEYKRFISPAAAPTYTGSPHGAHSYWRVFVTEDNGATPAIGELEFRATPSGADQATGGTATASSQYTSSYSPDKAFDGSGTTLWSAASGAAYGWVQYQFASPVEVSEVAVTSRHDGFQTTSPKCFSVQYADSASGPWTTIFSVNGQTGWSNSETRTFTDPNYL